MESGVYRESGFQVSFQWKTNTSQHSGILRRCSMQEERTMQSLSWSAPCPQCQEHAWICWADLHCDMTHVGWTIYLLPGQSNDAWESCPCQKQPAIIHTASVMARRGPGMQAGMETVCAVSKRLRYSDAGVSDYCHILPLILCGLWPIDTSSLNSAKITTALHRFLVQVLPWLKMPSFYTWLWPFSDLYLSLS